jgi:hypothetical protein
MLRAGSFLALAGLAACADQPATEPSDVSGPALAKAPSGSEAAVVGHPMLSRINARLTRARSTLRVGKAEIRYEAKAYNAKSSTEIFANDRTHTLPF